MDAQYLVVIAIVAAAVVYGATSIVRRSRAFSVKNRCEHDCGCNATPRKLT